MDSFGILALLQVLIAEHFGILALFQASRPPASLLTTLPTAPLNHCEICVQKDTQHAIQET